MTSLCKSANSDKDLWEKLGGFFEFPDNFRACSIIGKAVAGQGPLCVQALFNYTTLCQSCFESIVNCAIDFCATACLNCKSNFNILCNQNSIATGCVPRCISPDNAKFATGECASCLDTCYPAFQTCSGYSATRCTTCINPNAQAADSPIFLIVGGISAVGLILGLLYFFGIRRLRAERGVYKPNQIVVAKLAGDGPSTSKKSLKDDYSIGSQFATKRAQTVPPGLGFSQPARPQIRQYLPDNFVMEQRVEEYPQFIVAYNFEAENTDELDAEIGDVVIGLSQIDENWWMVQNQSGSRGLIPTDYLREPEPEEKVSSRAFARSRSIVVAEVVEKDPEEPEF